MDRTYCSNHYQFGKMHSQSIPKIKNKNRSLLPLKIGNLVITVKTTELE
jgi:hypothetical protein